MADVCGNCGSSDTAALADAYQCFNCGKSTTYAGENRESGLRYTSDVEIGPLTTAMRTVKAAEDQGIDVAAAVAEQIDSSVPNMNDLNVLAIENSSAGGSPKVVYDTHSTLATAEEAKDVAKALGGEYPPKGELSLPSQAAEDEKNGK